MLRWKCDQALSSVNKLIISLLRKTPQESQLNLLVPEEISRMQIGNPYEKEVHFSMLLKGEYLLINHINNSKSTYSC